MNNSVVSIPVENLMPHPDNPNRMSRVNFAKLVRNIKETACYEPIVVRPHPEKTGFFQIINGHHRCRALSQLHYKNADCVIWNLDDRQTDILLVTLNRLGGSDELGKKLVLLKRLAEKMETKQLAKILPHPSTQLDRLISLGSKLPQAHESPAFANTMVFVLSDEQQQVVEKAISVVQETREMKEPRAARRAAAITYIAKQFLQPASPAKEH